MSETNKIPADKELAALLPSLPLEQRIEAVIRKYVGGAVSSAYDGETAGPVADARIAHYLLGKLRPWLKDPALSAPQKQTADAPRFASAPLREGLEQLALHQHMVLDGEYGCNGVTCPGVQRLMSFGLRCVEFAAQITHHQEWNPFANLYLRKELQVYLDTLTITSQNIGDIRRSLFMPWDSRWNGTVREETAARENKPPASSVRPDAPDTTVTSAATGRDPESS